jgi:hypothetical protein
MRRVTLLLRVSGLPAYGPGAGSHILHFPDMPRPEEDDPGAQPDRPSPSPNVTLLADTPPSGGDPVEGPLLDGAERPPSPYPDVTLSILDEAGHELATAYIVEHKEPELDFTLHLPAAQPDVSYVARAEMTMNDEIVQTVQAPFKFTERT